MIEPMNFVAIGGFADLWLYSDPDSHSKRRHRDMRQHVIADACQTCGAPSGSPCHRPTIAGPVLRGLPHMERGRSLAAHNATYRRAVR